MLATGAFAGNAVGDDQGRRLPATDSHSALSVGSGLFQAVRRYLDMRQNSRCVRAGRRCGGELRAQCIEKRRVMLVLRPSRSNAHVYQRCKGQTRESDC